LLATFSNRLNVREMPAGVGLLRLLSTILQETG